MKAKSQLIHLFRFDWHSLEIFGPGESHRVEGSVRTLGSFRNRNDTGSELTVSCSFGSYPVFGMNGIAYLSYCFREQNEWFTKNIENCALYRALLYSERAEVR